MECSGNQHWILGLALVFMLCLVPTGSEGDVVFNCSRYKFNKNERKTWKESKEACESKNITLVAMETKAEWQFVNDQIQNINVTKNEWYIGLIKKNDVWKWINGLTLTYTDKWYGDLSTDQNINHAKMITYDSRKKRQGMFDDVRGDRQRLPFICEYPIVSNECTKHAQTTSSSGTLTTMSSLSSTPVTQSAKVVTTATTTKTTKAATTTTPTKPSTATSKSSNPIKITAKKQTSESRIITSIPTSHTAFLNTKTEVKETPKSAISTTVGKPKDHQKSDNKQNDGMMIIYIAVSLAVVLVILICVLGVWYWKRLKKEKRKISEDKLIDSSMATSPQPTTTANVNEIMKSSSFVAFKMVHNNLSTAPSGGPVYDNVCTDNNQGVDRGTQLTDTNEGSQGNQNVSVKKKKFSLKRNKGSLSESNRISKADEVKMNDVSASTSTDENKSSDEVVYAAVDKTKKKMVIQEVTYADLAPFNNNAEVNVHKPEPYQPVEYAVIIGKKASKSSK